MLGGTGRGSRPCLRRWSAEGVGRGAVGPAVTAPGGKGFHRDREEFRSGNRNVCTSRERERGTKDGRAGPGRQGLPAVPGDSGLRRPQPPPARITAFRQRGRFLRPQEPRQKQECGQRSSCLFQFSEFWCPPSHTHTNSRVPSAFSKGHAASHSLNRGGVASTPLSRYSPDG